MSIETELRRMPVRLRAAFAACCAERLLPAYTEYCARSGIVPALVERLAFVWAVVLGRRSASAAEVNVLFYEGTRTRVPPEARGTEYAQDAAIAILYALQSIAPSGEADVEGPLLAARHVTDALDRYLARSANIQPDDPVDTERVTNHDLLRAEVCRQERDLRELSGLLRQKDEWEKALTVLRDRAVQEHLEFLITAPPSGRS